MKGLAESMKAFKALVKTMPRKPSQAQYAVVRNAYHAVAQILGEGRMAEVWAKVKAKDPAYAAFAAFSEARTYRYHQTDEYREYQRKYQAEWAAKPENKAKRKAARDKYKAKLKAQKQAVAP